MFTTLRDRVRPFPTNRPAHGLQKPRWSLGRNTLLCSSNTKGWMVAHPALQRTRYVETHTVYEGTTDTVDQPALEIGRAAIIRTRGSDPANGKARDHSGADSSADWGTERRLFDRPVLRRTEVRAPRHFHTEEATGSIPVSPTIFSSTCEPTAFRPPATVVNFVSRCARRSRISTPSRKLSG